MTHAFVLILLVIIVAQLSSGCDEGPAPLPPVFRIDALRYWWEGEALVVNMTFTNIANFTPGEETLMPAAKLEVLEYAAKDGPTGGETVLKTWEAVQITFSPFPGSPWETRWKSSANTGPILISPGQPVSVEVELHPARQLSGSDGHYTVHVDLPSFYPQRFTAGGARDGTNAEYYTGCFNHSVAEFYGVNSHGPDCFYWDCAGGWTEVEYKAVKIHPQHDCSLTQHSGPI